MMMVDYHHQPDWLMKTTEINRIVKKISQGKNYVASVTTTIGMCAKE